MIQFILFIMVISLLIFLANSFKGPNKIFTVKRSNKSKILKRTSKIFYKFRPSNDKYKYFWLTDSSEILIDDLVFISIIESELYDSSNLIDLSKHEDLSVIKQFEDAEEFNSILFKK